MRVIGLTGGIACGKSTVSDWLKSQPDCVVIDGDQLSRELCVPGGAALPLIRDQFGDRFFLSDGSLNRRRLGSLVFSNSDARERLDRLMAPLLEDLTFRRLEEARRQGYTLCFLDFPLLFEKGYDRLCQSVWCVYLPRPLQLERLMARDGISREEAVQRMDAVLSSEEKASRSQVVIDNSGELSYTLSTLPPLLDAERQLAESGRRRRTDRYSDDAPVGRAGSASWQNEDPFSSALPSIPPSVSQAPAVMERPASARKKHMAEKAPWKLPVWMIALLTSVFFLVLICFASNSLMLAYLTRQSDLHRAEDLAVHAEYPLSYEELIEAGANEFNLNPAFVAAIIRSESSFQPFAESSVGARGLMQLMPDTAEWISGKMKFSGYAFDRMYDPETNIRFGCWYLNYLASLFRGDPVCVACAYHAGQGQVTAWLSDPLISEDGVSLSLSRLTDGPTKTYAGRVIRSYGIYQALYYSDTFIDAGNNASVLSGIGGQR